jgi:hypothetical protein
MAAMASRPAHTHRVDRGLRSVRNDMLKGDPSGYFMANKGGRHSLRLYSQLLGTALDVGKQEGDNASAHGQDLADACLLQKNGTIVSQRTARVKSVAI